MDTLTIVRIVGREECYCIQCHKSLDRVDRYNYPCVGIAFGQQDYLRFNHRLGIGVEAAKRHRYITAYVRFEFDEYRCRADIYFHVKHGIRAGTHDWEDHVLNRVVLNRCNRQVGVIHGQESSVHQVCKYIIRMRTALQ